MEQRIAIVTGGLRGLGRAMAFGLARAGHKVVAVGHIDADVAAIEAAAAWSGTTGRILPVVADLRRPADCDRVVATTLSRFAGVHILVNNAGLTFATIDPARFRRAGPPGRLRKAPAAGVRTAELTRREDPLGEARYTASSLPASQTRDWFPTDELPAMLPMS